MPETTSDNPKPEAGLVCYERQADLPTTRDEAFAWHERLGAFERLCPPWQSIEVERHDASLADGAEAIVKLGLGPLRLRWRLRHRDYEPGRRFCDEQVSGPFRVWKHAHLFEDSPADGSRCRLTDRIDFALPGPRFLQGALLAASGMRADIDRAFAYRHRVTAGDLSLHSRFADRPRMTVAITGATGLIGGALAAVLTTGGHRVVGLSRSAPIVDASDAQQDDDDRSPMIWRRWFPGTGEVDCLPPVDAVVHLAGDNIASGRWTSDKRERIRDSRVVSTSKLVAFLARLEGRPRVFVSASATGFYGDQGDALVDERSPRGEGFLADVAEQWESASKPLTEAGVRTVAARFGVVLTPAGGALAKAAPIFRLGLGGPMGSGRQWMSWVSLDDAVGALVTCLMDELAGPVNVVSPQPVRQREFARALGRALHRPSFMPAPAWALRAALGEMADDTVLVSTRVEPAALREAGYSFRHPSIDEALGHVLGVTR